MSKGLLRSMCLFTALSLATFAQKYKEGEYELYSEVTKLYAAGDFTKALAALETWSRKIPETDFLYNRQILYVQTYYAGKQPAKAIESASKLLAGDPDKIFPAPADRLRILYMVASAVKQVPQPGAAIQATATEAARQLAAIREPPKGMSAADWERARKDLETVSQSALLYLALLPVAQSMRANDCAGAEIAVRKVIEQHPASVQAAWYQGSALLCLARQQPARTSEALYAFARAAALDPVKGMVDPKWQQSEVAPYFQKFYEQYHGKDPEGMQKLKEQAVREPYPAERFHILSSSEIAQQKQADFESRNPELALWRRIREALAAENGETYFQSDLKNSEFPPLPGTLLSASPECRPSELSIAVENNEPAVLIKLEKPLRGKPTTGVTLRWQAVATAFQKSPFLLTMETTAEKLDGLQMTPCTPARKRD